MMNIQDILAKSFWGNTLEEYLISLAILVGSLLILRFIKFIGLRKLKNFSKKTKTDLDDAIIEAIDSLGWFFYITLSVYIAIQYLSISAKLMNIIDYVIIIIMTYYGVRFLQKVTNYIIKRVIKAKKANETEQSAINLIGKIAKGVLWVLAILLILANMGYDITTLLAGLGIGGIAVALAMQNILSDLFSSFSIYFDKPFKVGDFIVVGNDMGVVKKIGIKSTRLESLWGQEIVISNRELTSTRVNNYKRMEKRRIHFEIGVTYQTKNNKMKKIKKLVEKVFDKVDNADLDRVHFKKFGDSSLVYEIAYYVKSADYNEYMDIQEQVNLNIKGAFEKEKIEFAYPTRTIFMEK